MVRRTDSHSIDRTAIGKTASNKTAAGRMAAPNEAASVTDLKITYLPPDHLRRSSRNARSHSKKQLKQIARSIGRFGFVNPVLIADDLEIIAGHGRVEAAKMLGLKQVPTVRLSNLSPAERRAYMLADNRLAELAGWDRNLLATELQGLLEIQFDDVELTGFSLADVDLILEESAAKQADQDSSAAVPDEVAGDRARRPAVSRAGDFWLLGTHRLFCGDEPLDCDVMVRRWQHYTGKAARLGGSTLTFAEVEAARLARQGAATASRQGE
jgi:hypothetical protein